MSKKNLIIVFLFLALFMNINAQQVKTNGYKHKILITIGNTSFITTLENNATAIIFKAKLPMSIVMSELNGNEKYYYLNESLPSVSTKAGTIHNGDIMLYGTDCLVLFYKTFSTSYSYTQIGKIDNPLGLEQALGKDNIAIKFELLNHE